MTFLDRALCKQGYNTFARSITLMNHKKWLSFLGFHYRVTYPFGLKYSPKPYLVFVHFGTPPRLCKRYIEKCINLQQNSLKWAKFRVLYAKNYNGSKKVHHRRFCGGDFYQLCPKPDVFWNLGSERISIE